MTSPRCAQWSFCFFQLWNLTVQTVERLSWGFLFISVVEPNGTDCLNITGGSDGYYYIQPDPTKQPFRVYCDMTNGGFTLVWNFYPRHTPRKYLTVRLSVCPSMCLCAHPQICLYAYPPICLSVPIHGYPPICCAYPPMSVCLSMAIHPSVCMPIHPYICIPIHMSVCGFFSHLLPLVFPQVSVFVCMSIDNKMSRPIVESTDKRFFYDCSDLSWSVRGRSSQP